AFGIEPVDRVDQSHPGDLHQVLMGFAASAVAQRDVLGQRQAAGDHLVAGPARRARSRVELSQSAQLLGNVGVVVAPTLLTGPSGVLPRHRSTSRILRNSITVGSRSVSGSTTVTRSVRVTSTCQPKLSTSGL